MPGRRDLSLTPAEVDEYLVSQRTGVLASNGRAGFPHQMAMWYLPEAGRIHMWTYARSQKAVNLRRDARASFLVEDGDTYPTLRGVLIQGMVELIHDPAQVLSVGTRLRLRYNPGADADAVRDYIERQAPKRLIISLPMERIASWDHRRLS